MREKVSIPLLCLAVLMFGPLAGWAYYDLRLYSPSLHAYMPCTRLRMFCPTIAVTSLLFALCGAMHGSCCNTLSQLVSPSGLLELEAQVFNRKWLFYSDME